MAQGPLYTGTGANFNDGGTTAWTNPTNIQGDTTTTAATVSPPANGNTSQRLRCSNFGFSIPTGATIVGITVEVEQQAANASRHRWNSVQLLIAGSETGTDKSDASAIPTGKAFKTFGSSADLWGLTPTVSQVNASGFGVSLKIDRNSSQATTTSLFRARITVDYTVVNNLTASDTVTVSESVTKVASMPRSFADTVSSSDSADRAAATRSRTGSDTVAGSDNVSAARGIVRTGSDATSVSDAVVRAVAGVRAAADITSLSDTPSRVAAMSVTATDAVSLSETASRANASRARTTSDTTSLSDQVGQGALLVPRSASDAVSSSDAIAELFGYVRLATDSQSTSDAPLRAVAAVRAVEDVESVVDAAARLVDFVREMTDQVVDSDQISANIGVPVEHHQGWVGATARAPKTGAGIRRKGNVGIIAR